MSTLGTAFMKAVYR